MKNEFFGAVEVMFDCVCTKFYHDLNNNGDVVIGEREDGSKVFVVCDEKAERVLTLHTKEVKADSSTAKMISAELLRLIDYDIADMCSIAASQQIYLTFGCDAFVFVEDECITVLNKRYRSYTAIGIYANEWERIKSKGAPDFLKAYFDIICDAELFYIDINRKCIG